MLDVTRPFLFVQPFLSLTATEKKQKKKKNRKITAKHHPLQNSSVPRRKARRQRYERERGPWLFS